MSRNIVETLLGVQFSDAADQLRAVLDRRLGAPVAHRLVGAPDRVAQLVVGDRRVLLDGLPGGRIDNGVKAHGRKLAPARRRFRTTAGHAILRSRA